MKKKLSDVQSSYAKDKQEFQKGLASKVSICPKRCLEEKKLLELRIIKLTSQISDFEKVLITERDSFNKERTEFDVERKYFEEKSIEFSGKINEIEKGLEKERKFFEERKNSFEKEKKNFKDKSVKLFKKITDLELTLEKERKESDFEREESVKIKMEGFQAKCLKDDFEKERRIFKLS